MSALALAFVCVIAVEVSAAPSRVLLQLDGELDRELQGFKAGSIGDSDHSLFLKNFRPRLDSALNPGSVSSEDTALYALLLSRLGARERTEALSTLDAALGKSPGDSALLKARGQILLEGGDFAGAAAAARAVLKGNADRREPSDPEALRLFHASDGRGSGAQSPPLPQGAGQAPTPNPYAPRSPVQYSKAAKRTNVDIPAVRETESDPVDGKSWLTRSKEWALELGTSYVGRVWHAKPEEEKTVREGVATGGLIGAGVAGAGSALFAAPVCGPAVVTGAGYVGCVGAAVTGGTVAGTAAGGFAGGSVALGVSRLKANYSAILGEDKETE